MSIPVAYNLRSARERWMSSVVAVLGIAGDVTAADVFARVERYFGAIPARPVPAPPGMGRGSYVCFEDLAQPAVAL